MHKHYKNVDYQCAWTCVQSPQCFYLNDLTFCACILNRRGKNLVVIWSLVSCLLTLETFKRQKKRKEITFGLLGAVESESRMCIYPWRAEKGEEPNMSSGEHGIPMTSPGQVLFACIFPKSGRDGGGLQGVWLSALNPSDQFWLLGWRTGRKLRRWCVWDQDITNKDGRVSHHTQWLPNSLPPLASWWFSAITCLVVN